MGLSDELLSSPIGISIGEILLSCSYSPHHESTGNYTRLLYNNACAHTVRCDFFILLASINLLTVWSSLSSNDLLRTFGTSMRWRCRVSIGCCNISLLIRWMLCRRNSIGSEHRLIRWVTFSHCNTELPQWYWYLTNKPCNHQRCVLTPFTILKSQSIYNKGHLPSFNYDTYRIPVHCVRIPSWYPSSMLPSIANWTSDNLCVLSYSHTSV